MIKQQLPKAIIFDWDNTLVDTWPVIHSAIDATMVKMGRDPWGLEKVKKHVGKSMRESFPALFGQRWEEAGNFYRDYYHSNNLHALQLLPGAADLIAILHKMDITLFVISNKIGDTLRKEVDHLGLKNYFFAIIGAMDAKYDKPAREPVELALLGSDLDPERDLIWFIGDTEVDIECAYNSGCQPVFYGNHVTLPDHLVKKVQGSKYGSILNFSTHEEIAIYINNTKSNL